MTRIPYVETVEDSRVRGVHPVTGKRAVIQRLATGEERVYCVSCHHPGAYVSSDVRGVIYLCGSASVCGCDCEHTRGQLTLPRLAI